MKIKGRCLICDKKLQEQEIAPESINIHQELTHAFFRYLCSNDLSLADGKSSLDSYADIFPFCVKCEQQVVTKLYQKHAQIQTGLRRIQQIMAISRSQRILCEIVEERSLPGSLDISSDEETEEYCEQKPLSATASTNTKEFDDDYSDDLKSEPKCAQEEMTVAAGIANCGTSDIVTVNEEAIDANSTDANGSSAMTENYLEELRDSHGSPANEPDHDGMYTMSSESSDEGFTASGPSASKNLNGSIQTCGEEDLKLLSPSSSSHKSAHSEISGILDAGLCNRQTKVIPNHLLRQTGPTTYIYMEKYSFERLEKGYKCCACGYTKVKRAFVMRHIRNTHNRGLTPIIRMVEKSPHKWYIAEFMTEKMAGKFSCVTCRYACISRRAMRDHLIYSHYVTAHPEWGAALNFVCEVCGKVVPRIKMREHFESHIDEPQFACRDCDKKFVNQIRLSAHRKIHLGEQGKKVICEHCGRKFCSQHALKDHMFQHTGKRDFICKTCGNSYGSSGALGMHSNLHKGRRFDCEVCGAEFTQAYSLTRHKLSHHGIHSARAKGKPAEI